MMRYARVAALAVVLTGAGVIASQAADTSGPGGTIRYVQMNSPGDGLDKDAASQGNGRPSKRAVPQRKKSMKRH